MLNVKSLPQDDSPDRGTAAKLERRLRNQHGARREVAVQWSFDFIGVP